MAFRIRQYPHNDVLNRAHYHHEMIAKKLAEGNHDGIALDCTSCLIALAFSVEALVNFVGSRKVTDWNEHASVATCVNCRRLQGAQVIVNLGDLVENRGMEKYIVTLSAEEREQLEAIVSKGSHQSRKIINGLILLNCDVSSGRARRSTQEVAAVLHVSERKIDRVKKRFVEEGYDAALVRPPSQRIYDSKIDGELEARLIALSCSEPPEGQANWSLRLLAQRAVELEYVDSLSHETVRRALKKTN